MTVHQDCRYFKGDRPCRFHKKEGVHCDNCRHFDPVSERILIIKLDAIGDVLRTTSILPALKEKYPRSLVTWITKAGSLPLFFNNSFVDRTFDLSEANFVLGTDAYDLVINLDASPLSSRLATLAVGKEKIGFLYHEQGYVYPANAEAEEWFYMGIFDDLKKRNKKTYQQIAHEICRLPAQSDQGLVLSLTKEEEHFAWEFAQRHDLGEGPVIGLNTGAGGRWQFKKWTIDGYVELIRRLKTELPNSKILLYGGPEEKERNETISKMIPGLIDAGSDNGLREFAALVGLCDVLVTGDTLAMHIAIALKRKVVVLFGPTSSTEIDVYGNGEKVVSPVPCVCCYQLSCDVNPNCMESIAPGQVFEAVQRMLDNRFDS